MEGYTSIDEIVRVIDIADDFGDDDTELKNALIGKINSDNNENIETL